MIEPFAGHGEQAADSVQRIMFPAPVAELFGLDAPAAFVESLVRVLHHMKPIGDLSDVGEAFVEDLAIRTRQVQHPEPGSFQPPVGLVIEPDDHPFGGAGVDDIDQLARIDVNDRGRPRPAPEPSEPAEQNVIDPERLDRADTLSVGCDQCFAVGHNRVVHGVPISTQL